MRMGSNKESSKENDKPAPGIKSLVNFFRPIREWLHTRPKTSTPISSPILRSSSANGHPQHPGLSVTSPANNITNNNNNNNLNRNNIFNSTNNSNNSYGGNSLSGLSSSGDMLSTANPTPIHHQHLNSVAHHRYTPVANGHSTFNGLANNTIMTSGTMEDIDGSLVSGIGNPANAGMSVAGMGPSNEGGHFSRNAQARMSLPIMQQNKMRRQAYNQLQRRGQQVARSLGFIYLQHKGETKQANLPNELTTIDTIRALFVCAFPHMLSMEFMSQPNIKIYIYSPSCNIFYELSDIEEVRHESVLRIHYSDPLLPVALPHQVSLSSLGGPMQANLSHHYGTIQRLPPRPPPQIQQQQQPGSQSSLGQPMAHMMQQMPQSSLHPMMNGPTMASQLSQIPPPKPRRMIPASYTIHRLNSVQQ